MSRITDALRRAAAEREDANGSESAHASERTPTIAELAATAWPEEVGVRPSFDKTWSASPKRSREDSRSDASPHPLPLHDERSANALVEAPARPWPPVEQRVPLAPTEQHLARYWQIVRCRWRLGLLAAVVVVGGATAGVLLQTPMYRATGLLEIRPESAVAVPVDTLFSGERLPTDELETQFGILKSATLADRVAREFASRGRIAAAGGRSVVSDSPDTDRRSDAGSSLSADAVRTGLKINPLKGSRLVEVSFDSPNAARAAWVVNAAFDSYLQLRMEEAQRSAKWLHTQLRQTQERLMQSERQLQAYVRTHGLEVFETGRGEAAQVLNERLQSLRALLATAEAERMQKQSAEEQVRSRATSRDLDSAVVQTLNVRLADLRQEHAKLAAVFHDDYPRVQILRNQIAEVQRELDGEMSRVVSRAQSEVRSAARREALLRQALQAQEQTVRALAGRSASMPGYEALKRELVTNQEQFTVVSQKLKDVSISAALKASNVGIVDRAAIPRESMNASAGVSIGLALIVGLLMGGGIMLVQEHLDTSIRTAGDVDSYLGVPTLATIPAAGTRRALPGSTVGGWRRIDRTGRHHAALNEAFAALRASVLLRDGASAPAVMLITSAHPQEGKTTVAVNLALSLARLNTRVLLIDANMRAPSVPDALGVASEGGGLVAYLTGEDDWHSFVQRGAMENLDAVESGTPEDDSPADLLSLSRMPLLLDAAAREYDFVIVDSPAVLANPADVQSLAAVSGGVLLVVRQGRTPRDAVMLAASQLGRIEGVVLNHQPT